MSEPLLPSICEEPGCGGKVNPVTKKCEKCKVRYDGNPEAQAFLAETGTNQQVALPPLSNLSNRDPVMEVPADIWDIITAPSELSRDDQGISTLSVRETLGGGLVDMPRVQPVDRLAQIDPTLRSQLEVRVCSNIRWDRLTAKKIFCEEEPDATGTKRRTRLYWKQAAIPQKLPPNCRLETVTDGETGEATVMIVPDKGFCRKCGTAFDFTPLPKGTMIDQFRVEGQFVAGGDGMLYHATDTELDLPVVIKALHNTNNQKGEKIATAEVGALVLVQGKPGILRVCGYKNYKGRLLIVMEWLNGATLYDIRVDNNGPLPLEVGLSYLMGAIQGIRVGHDLTPALLHLDIKHLNLMVLAPGDHLKVIDYGGCQIEGKPGQDRVRTEGFSAPELYPDDPINGGKKHPPSKASDVYALGRLFCFLSLPFTLTGKYRFTLPPPSEVPQFAEYESAYRFARAMTAIDPAARLTLAEAYEAAAALRQEVIALKTRRAVPSVSSIFLPDSTKSIALDYKTLPLLRVDLNDEAVRTIEEALGASDLNRQRALLEQAIIQYPNSKEARLRLASLTIDLGDCEFAKQTLDQLAAKDPFDCRIVYQLGRLALAVFDLERATRCFDACYSAWPGEVAIKLPNGLCAELTGKYARASRLYETAAWVNPDFTAGPFGWARVAIQEKQWTTAIDAFNRVPRTSWAYKTAVIGRVNALLQILAGATASGIGLVELQQAAEAASFVVAEGDSLEGFRIKADVFKAAISVLKSRSLKADKSVLLLGVPLGVQQLRQAASQALIQGSKLAGDRYVRNDLVDEARAVAGWSFF